MNLKKMTIDGVEVEMTETAVQVVSKQIARIDGFEEKLNGLMETVSKEKARADKAEEDLAAEKKAREDAASPEKQREAVSARLDLERKAALVLGAEEKLDALTDEAIMTKVVIKASKSDDIAKKLEGADAVYLRARFDQALEGVEAKKSDTAGGGGVNPFVNAVRSGAVNSGEVNDAESARQRMIKDNYDAGRRALGNADRQREALEAIVNLTR